MKLRNLLVFILVFVMCFGFCACAEDDSAKVAEMQSKAEEIKSRTSFSVKVVDQNGNIVQGVVLKIRRDSPITARTNNRGIATFRMSIGENCKLIVMSCPHGYEYNGDPAIPIKAGTSEYVLKITKK